VLEQVAKVRASKNKKYAPLMERIIQSPKSNEKKLRMTRNVLRQQNAPTIATRPQRPFNSYPPPDSVGGTPFIISDCGNRGK
jgi:hypothetical protein